MNPPRKGTRVSPRCNAVVQSLEIIRPRARAAVFAASEDADYAAPLYPTCLEDATTQKIAAMWDFQLYHRCHLYGDSYVTSDGWRKQQKRDNSWLVFQHYTGPYVSDTLYSVLNSSGEVVNSYCRGRR